ncbi:MAG: Tyrosine--tRNA ligase [Parcubacteria group bacterium ADurb.Bin159]|nr:MAG: Tyrosine--tRNA ligase [Parcubacteria group bacterium ADurb.Bin159]
MEKEEKKEEWIKQLKENLINPPKIKADITIEEEKKIILEKTAEVYTEHDLWKKLKKSKQTKKPLIIKYGIDPTSSGFHLGHFVFLRQLKKIQDLGHQIIFLIGDFTARIGDPSDKKAARQPLTKAQVEQNMKNYFSIVSRYIKFGEDGKKAKLAYNSRWLSKLNLEKFFPLTSTLTVSQMLERDCFSRRFKDNKPIGVNEFLYPLLQGYDSVALKADVEIGGRDQTFNMLVGRDLQKRFYNQEPQVVLTFPLLLGINGQKMSKTLKNYISLTDKPQDIYGKIMSLPDNLMKEYFLLLTDIKLDEWHSIEKAMRQGLNPMEVKKVLAEVITAQIYNPKIAEKERERFVQLFSQRKITGQKFETIKTVLPQNFLDILYEYKFIKTKMEGRRLFSQSAIKMIKEDGSQEIIKDPKYKVSQDGLSFKIGKKIFITIKK